jgi:hypothetical protein
LKIRFLLSVWKNHNSKKKNWVAHGAIKNFNSYEKSFPPLAALGFIEALIGMFILVWLAGRHEKKLGNKPAV